MVTGIMKRLLLFLVVAATVAGAWAANQQGWIAIPWPPKFSATASAPPSEDPSNASVPVVAAEARYADVPVTTEAIGTVQALNSVLIRSQVDGRLMRLAFKEGEDLKRGDLVAQIDPTTYQALYNQAVAKKAQDEANLSNAKLDLARYVKLADENFGPRQQADTQKYLVAQLGAQVQLDQAAIDNAKAVLDYSTIRSPIDGRVGIRQVDEGNLIHATDATGIVTISQIQPISLIFNLPQQLFRAVSTAMRRGVVKAQALDADNGAVVGEGEVAAIDNQVDPTTGTVKIRATFPNDDLALWPGEFVNVRVFTDVLKHVVVVPVAAVQRGADGAFVYLVSDKGRAALAPVTVARQDDSVAVIDAGVEPPSLVITTGFNRVTDKTRVKVAPAEEPKPKKVPKASMAEAATP